MRVNSLPYAKRHTALAFLGLQAPVVRVVYLNVAPVLLLTLAIFYSNLALAAPVTLQLPIDCEIGFDCHIQNSFDHDPGPGFADFNCGVLGYDGHRGTDIRLANLAEMRRGVAVVAAASGRVRAIRDEMPDISIRDAGEDSVSGREAGNAVVLTHEPDWETQYSHLLKGSVRVRPGDWVEAGDVLGLVGLSGQTEFPHLHFEVRYRGEAIDPFVGLSRASECGLGVEPLWSRQALNKLPYRPTGLLQTGFSSAAPSTRSVDEGEKLSGMLPPDSVALVFWVEIFGAHKGDVESIDLFDTDGKLLAKKRARIPRDKARWFSYAGKKRRGDAWAPGLYRAVYRLARGEGETARFVIDIERTIAVQ